MDIALEIINIIGIISFAAAGAMVAIDKETDLFGVLLLSLITCFGGGMMRDMIAGKTIGLDLPVVFKDMKMEIIVCISTALVVFFLAMIFKEKYIREEASVERINNVLDALGIGVFTVAGTSLYINSGFGVAVFMGLLTAVGGSIIRDVILGTIPMVLRKRIYAIACIAGSIIYYLIVKYFMLDMKLSDVVGTVSCIGFIFVARMCATYFRWNLPVAIKFSKLKDENPSEKEKETTEV